MALGRAYCVRWADSSFIKGWQYPDAGGVLPEPREIESLGWLVKIDTDHIVLASTQNGDGVLNALAIPRGCLTAMEEVTSATA